MKPARLAVAAITRIGLLAYYSSGAEKTRWQQLNSLTAIGLTGRVEKRIPALTPDPGKTERERDTNRRAGPRRKTLV